MKLKQSLVLSLAVILTTPLIAADNSGIKNTTLFHQLSLASALEAAQSSIAECRKDTQNVSATVVDRNGLTQVILRDTNASAISSELSRKKAYTAANFQKNTTQLADLSDTAVGRSHGVLMSAGGVLITVNDIIYGAVGVSGSSTGAKDDLCAKAGAQVVIDAIIADKEQAVALEEAKAEVPEVKSKD
ncbi:GlcG/HbpS family heme-binding protein [Leucothrix arctica]|uniref:Adenosylcobalamin biosynthesis, GlcG-related protein n=1 Tax=Leucothrix arctica TaxID=1481894 RepID=A0A317C6F2_9GAMM|nr:heme-binding protein [Leucothrix arctica]PWQ93859.1 adenosylcobalamin biosynthesis, GlcG-related protein [Leucothrix arctica]